jgi:hypothetical protein
MTSKQPSDATQSEGITAVDVPTAPLADLMSGEADYPVIVAMLRMLSMVQRTIIDDFSGWLSDAQALNRQRTACSDQFGGLSATPNVSHLGWWGAPLSISAHHSTRPHVEQPSTAHYRRSHCAV